MDDKFLMDKRHCWDISMLLELAASDDVLGFKTAVEMGGHDIDEASLWYERKVDGSKNMGFEERTPLMIAAKFGSMNLLNYIIETGQVDVNRTSKTDGATALHCAVAGGSASTVDVVKRLLDASADCNILDCNGKRAADLIEPTLRSVFSSKKKKLDAMLKDGHGVEEACDLAVQTGETEGQERQENLVARGKDGAEKKEYPIDLSLPDIKNGIYGTDEFRMYVFKIKPCSRAYSHDWTECPFVHPGENARRRDPRKYHYSCVPCPEYRKGSCNKGDNCEYAHGIFECWLHPAQYRTRLCKDETNCKRRVCFFAHRPEELRPLYAATGSAIPSPNSFSAGSSSLDMASISPLGLGSPSVLRPSTSTPPLTPSGAPHQMSGTAWQNTAPPALQLPSGRFRTGLSARNVDLDIANTGLESHLLRQQQLMDEISMLSTPSRWKTYISAGSALGSSPRDRNPELRRFSGMNSTNVDDIYGSLDTELMPQLENLSLDAAKSQLQSPMGIHVNQEVSPQLSSSYSNRLSTSTRRASPSFTKEPSAAAAAAVLNSRSSAFAKRSQSFIERSAASRPYSLSSPLSSTTAVPSNLSGWSSPDGKLDWSIQGQELNKLRKCSSFGLRSNGSNFAASLQTENFDDHEFFRNRSLVNNYPSVKPVEFVSGKKQQQHYNLNAGGSETLPAWLEQLYMEQEQMVA